MKKNDKVKMVRDAADSIAATTEKSIDFDQYFLCIDNTKTALLTSALGTQPLLTASSPTYPIISAD